MKSLEGMVSYPWPKPAKRMINGAAIEDSDSDGEGTLAKAMGAKAKPVEQKKIALIVDTNVLLRQTNLRELMKMKD